MTRDQQMTLIAALVASTMYQCGVLATALVQGNHPATVAILICMGICYLSALVQVVFGQVQVFAGIFLVASLAAGAYAGFAVAF